MLLLLLLLGRRLWTDRDDDVVMVSFEDEYDNGAGNVSSRRLGWEKRDFHWVSSGSGEIGKEELWTSDCNRNTNREWAWVRATNFKVPSSCSGLGNGEERDVRACTGYRWRGTL
jgi:hypothetical protein